LACFGAAERGFVGQPTHLVRQWFDRRHIVHHLLRKSILAPKRASFATEAQLLPNIVTETAKLTDLTT